MPLQIEGMFVFDCDGTRTLLLSGFEYDRINSNLGGPFSVLRKSSRPRVFVVDKNTTITRAMAQPLVAISADGNSVEEYESEVVWVDRDDDESVVSSLTTELLPALYDKCREHFGDSTLSNNEVDQLIESGGTYWVLGRNESE